MTLTTSEHEIQSAIIDLIRLRGGVVTRINSGSMITKRNDRTYCVQLADKGTSDLIALYKGVYLAIEVKGANGKASDEQIAFLESVAEAGGVGLLAYDVDFVSSLMDRIDFSRAYPPSSAMHSIELLIVRPPNRLFVRSL